MNSDPVEIDSAPQRLHGFPASVGERADRVMFWRGGQDERQRGSVGSDDLDRTQSGSHSVHDLSDAVTIVGRPTRLVSRCSGGEFGTRPRGTPTEHSCPSSVVIRAATLPIMPIIQAAETELEPFIGRFEAKRQAPIGAAGRVLRRRLRAASELVHDKCNAFVLGSRATERSSECLVSIRPLKTA